MYYNLEKALKNKDKKFEFKYGSRERGDKMYEVTYSIDGVIKKISVVANDAITAQNLATNMFGSGKVQIIDIRRK